MTVDSQFQRRGSYLYVEEFIWNIFTEKIEQKRLFQTDFMLYCAMCRLANKLGNHCFPGINFLAKEISKSDVTVMESIKRLVKEGLITKEIRTNLNGSQKTNLYTILNADEYLKNPLDISTGNEKSHNQCPQVQLTPGSSAVDPNNNNNNNNYYTSLRSDNNNYYSCEFGIQFWNSLNQWQELKMPRNKTVSNKLLPICQKKTEQIEMVWNKLRPTEEDFKYAVKKYISEIANRTIENDYCRHRFSFYEFIKQKNGFVKFLNR